MLRIPPAELIIDNKIGGNNPETIQKLFEERGEGLAAAIKRMVGMTPDHHVLDMGCGLGRVARPLVDFFSTGTYTGVDVVKSSIDWCREHYDGIANFTFLHAEIFSTFYNPTATVSARDYRFPFDDKSFDVIFSASLFTHLLIDEVDNYLKEMARVLKPGGKVWNSYLILDEKSEPMAMTRRPNTYFLPHPVDGGRVARKENPEYVVGLYKHRLEELHAMHGLAIDQIALSNWSGGRPETKFMGQDLIMATKA